MRLMNPIPGPASLLVALAVGCGGDPEDVVEPPAPELELLAPTDRLIRASMALRGIRPSIEELEAVHADPAALDAIVDTYVDAPEFGETIKDLHAEILLLRTDTSRTMLLPVMGILQGRGLDQGEVNVSITEAPLVFVEDIVMSDRPYTEVLTAQYTLADSIVADIYGLPYDPNGETWQRTTWVDGRPLAGLLSDSQMWRRHQSNAANFHRGRANLVSDTFLCENIASRDVVVEGGIDVSDPLAVAEAVSTTPTCIGCHAVLDPLAAYFWGYKEKLGYGSVAAAIREDCQGFFFPEDPLRGSYDMQHYCYPLKFFVPGDADMWGPLALPPPSFFGQPAESMTDLGELITEDPRFAQCMARTYYGWLGQVPREEVPFDVTTELKDDFVANDYSIKQLALQIVATPEFNAIRPTSADPFVIGLQSLRPGQYTRTVEDLTGFVWLANQDTAQCASDGDNDCWGEVDLANTDLVGFRSMMGGLNGFSITQPTHTSMPTKVMAIGKMASEAGGWVVFQDFSSPVEERKLLRLVERDTTDEAQIREQLAWLHLRILGEFLDPAGDEIDATWALWSGSHARAGTEVAWSLVISTLLQDVRMVYY